MPETVEYTKYRSGTCHLVETAWVLDHGPGPGPTGGGFESGCDSRLKPSFKKSTAVVLFPAGDGFLSLSSITDVGQGGRMDRRVGAEKPRGRLVERHRLVGRSRR